jgi:zinc-ribbon domain
MAFCNSCGASMVPGTRFCSKCGAAVVASSPASAVTPPVAGGTAPPATSTFPAASAPAPNSGGALKAILIVVGVIVLVGILGVTSVAFFAWRVAHHTHVRQEGDNVKVETPFGTVQTTTDPQEAARTLGVDLYPGAQVLKEGAASATFGGVHTASLNFESADSVDKVASFYKSRFPNAMVVSSEANRCTIVSNDHKSMVTINIEAAGDRTKIQITNVTRRSDAPNSSSN